MLLNLACINFEVNLYCRLGSCGEPIENLCYVLDICNFSLTMLDLTRYSLVVEARTWETSIQRNKIGC
jgi:hypothetical protein